MKSLSQELKAEIKSLSRASQNKEKALKADIKSLSRALQNKENALKAEINRVNIKATIVSHKVLDIEIMILKSSLADLIYDRICQKLFKKIGLNSQHHNNRKG